MSQAPDTTTLTTFLNSLDEALEDGNPADVLAFLRVLRMNGLDDEESAELIAAYSDNPGDAHRQQVREWSQRQRAALDSPQDSPEVDNPFSDDAFFDVDDELSVDDEFDVLEELDDFDDFDDFDGFDDVDDFDGFDDVDDFDGFDDVDDFDGFGDFDDLESFDDIPASEPHGAMDSPAENTHAPESSDSFPPGDHFIDTGTTPAPPPTTDQLSSSSNVSLADDFDSDVSHTPAAVNSTITGEREKTRQLDSNHLQALSDAASSARQPHRSLSSETSSPSQTSDSSGVHDQPTRRQFEAPDTGPRASATPQAPDSGVEPGTTEMPSPQQFDSGDKQVPQSSQQPATAEDFDPRMGLGADSAEDEDNDDFDFDFGLTSGDSDEFTEGDESPSQGLVDERASGNEPEDHDDFDFDFGPAPAEDGSDDFELDSSKDDSSDDDFDFGPAPAEETSADDDDFASTKDVSSDDDDFDFDFGPDSSSAGSQSSANEQPSKTVDDEMGYAPPPEDDFFPPPVQSAPQPSEASQEYASPPQGDSFFPPPLTASQDSSQGADSEKVSSPFPESPSAENEAPPSSSRSPQRPQYKTPLFESSEVDAFDDITNDATSMDDSASLDEATSQKEASTSSPPDPARSPLPEEELLALGEELSSSRSKLDSATSPGEPERASSSAGYRGEPVIPEVGNEATPARNTSVPGEPVVPHGTASNEPTGSFAAPQNQVSATPSGTFSGTEEPSSSAGATPPGGVSPLAASSSFILEEVRDPESNVSDPADAIKAAMEQARSLYGNGQFDEAMELVDAVFEIDANCEDAHELQGLLEGELERAEISRLGSLAKTPSLNISMGEIAGLDLDHRAGFLISQIDGMLTFNDILDMSSMSRLETLNVLNDLNDQGIIDID